MPIVTVHTTPTSYRLVTTPSLYIPNTPINLYHHLRPFNELKWDHQQKRMVVKKHYYYRNDDDGMTFIPRYDLPRFTNMVESRGGQVRTREIPLEWGKKVDIPLADWYKPRDQTQVDALDYAVNSTHPMRCLALQPGFGKAHTVDTPIKIPGGWCLMGDIKVGNTVIAQDGTHTKVIGVYPQGLRMGFGVFFEDGRSVVVDRNHLWEISSKSHRCDVRSTADIMDLLEAGRSVSIPLIEPEEMPAVTHEVDPYYAGRMASYPDIDPAYLVGSVAQRWAYFQGMMDDRATVGDSGTIRYVSTDPAHTATFVEFARSFGCIATPREGCVEIVYRQPNWLFRDAYKKSRAEQYARSGVTSLGITNIVVDRLHEMQCIAVDHPRKLYVCGSYIATHNTSIGIVSSSRIGRRALIKTPILVNQWIGAIKKFTKLTDDDIYVISGSASLARLLSEIDKTLFPKIILASVQTIRAYAQREAPYHIFPRIEDFCNLCDIGIVVSDEVHLFFHTGLMLDMMLNPRVMIPMSATYEVTDRQIEPIFDGHFPKNLRFGEDRYERYVTVTSYTFDIPSDKLAKSQYRTFAGYNHTLYEKDLLKKKPVIDRIIRDVYYPILELEYFTYAQPGERLLIICARTEMCAYLVKILKRDYPDKKVALFIAGTPESVKSENDIIVSTVKSAGVGFDVPNLITTFVTVAADSPPLNKQLLGRLRKVEGRSPRLAYVACRQLESHRKYTQTRRMIFPPLAKEFHAHHL